MKPDQPAVFACAYTQAELPALARRLWALWQPAPRVWALGGPMGAGKTSLVQALVQALGYTQPVTSPTYSLVNVYHTAAGTVYHMDLHRLETEAELLETGLADYLEGDDICLIEWPERILHWLPPGSVFFSLSVIDIHTRKLQLESYI
ncbi:MAG: tRNA (adenosine(37)-N6)-threonylcarbamoyltransferase complex ATPase subunit type 1 TsaE [Bacteroidetes bacterium]|nr:tRNA (adenosine(37)-N6)-threonylcarbamoyltransferase complex ATPase subunit type 1 TsaE [Bacteroidota bacterium]